MSRQSSSSLVSRLFGKAKTVDFISIILAYVVIVVFFAFSSEYFFSVRNFLNIGMYASIIGISACGMTLVLVSGHIDLSVGSIMALSGMVLGKMIPETGSVLPYFILALVVAGIAGAINGLLITKVKVNAFITTIATMQIFRGISYILSKSKTITIPNPGLKWIGRGYTLGIPNALLLFVLFVVLFYYISRYTIFGRRLYVIGGNAQAAYLSGIHVSRIILLVYIINGLAAGVSGIILSSQIGAAMPQSGSGIEFEVISAVILGGTSLSGGKGSLIGTFIGGLLLATLNNGMVMLNIPSYWQSVIIGVVLVFAVSFDVIKNRRR
jgi:ribose transport system permease protein